MTRWTTLAALTLPLLIACGDKETDEDDGTGEVDTADEGGDDSGGSGSGTDEPVDSDGDGVPDAEDCAPDDASTYPGADEVCDEVDNDCDGDIDEDAVDATVFYLDEDEDGYGADGTEDTSCELPGGTAVTGGDCDDTNADINPFAEEICDEVDNDCDGDIDDADEDVDTCERDWSGRYRGPFTIDVTATTLGISDTCTGTGNLFVDPTISPALRMDASCTYAGPVAVLLPGPQSGTLTGDFDTPDTASGTIEIGGGIVTDTWTGLFTAPDTFTATIRGTTTLEGIDVEYSGQFTGER